jgi:Rrf2 family transcriptional regulator, iron-sulfur cluster assembly transcription factor
MAPLSLYPRRFILAIAAVTDIAINAHYGPVSAKDLASRQKLPRRHLELVLQALVLNGILTSTRGARGGYQLARKSNLISADEILRAASGAEEEIGGAEPKSQIGRKIVIPALRQAERALSEALQRITVNKLARSAVKLNLDSGGSIGGA